MSETAENTPAENTPENETENTQPDPAEELRKWKALARKHEQRAKENSSAAEELAKIRESQKTEAEKLQDKVSAAEKRAAEVEMRALRAEVAFEKGLTPAQAKRLVGTTKEELEADADDLLNTFGSTKTTPDFGGGNRGKPIGGKSAQLTRDQLKSMTPEAIAKAKAEGRLDNLLGKGN